MLRKFLLNAWRTVSVKNCELYFCHIGRNSTETKPQREKYAEALVFLDEIVLFTFGGNSSLF
jgi:hypothetical protein